MSETPRQSVRGLPASDWRYAIRRAGHGFLRHRGLDSAAALSFFAALAVTPIALATMSVLAIVNGRDAAASVLLAVIAEVAQPDTVQTIREPLFQLLNISSPWLALGIGLVLSVWTLSAYGTAFGRAVNSVYEVQEGRQFWKFRGAMMLLAVFLLIMFAVIGALLLTTPRVAEAIGIPEPWLTVWNVVRWPAMLLLIALVIAVLYYVTPAVRHERVRWVSVGAAFAIVVWSTATLGFAFYVSIVGGYDQIYGWLGGLIVLLLWLYLTNLVLVLGAELDAEAVRLRQLRAGLPAEEVVLLPMRDTRRNLMLAEQRAADVAQARSMREEGRPE